MVIAADPSPTSEQLARIAAVLGVADGDPFSGHDDRRIGAGEDLVDRTPLITRPRCLARCGGAAEPAEDVRFNGA